MIAKFIMKLFGWKLSANLPDGIDRCVMIAVPHTSNWDLFYARLAFYILKIPVKFTIKDSWFKFPFNLVFGAMGGIPINRRPKKEGEERPSMVEAMVDVFKTKDDIAMMITPEGTRAKRVEWKSGFYHVAKMANVPIALGFLDYKKKLAGVGKLVYPSNDLAKDMKEIMDFYEDITPKHPERFSLDLRYI